MALTDTALRALKPTDKPYKRADSGGLYILVQPNGATLWRFDYRYLGTRKTMALGAYPIVTLAQARNSRDAAKSTLAMGLDPGAERKAGKARALAEAENTFELVAREMIEKMRADGRAEPTIKKNEWMLLELAKPLARRPVARIPAADVLSVLRRIEKSGRVESALATRAAIGRVFRYAIATARAENDPTSALSGALQQHVPVSHPALTKPSDVGGLMRAINDYDGWFTLKALIKFCAYCFPRPSEGRTMEWSEVDLATGVWTIPADKAKMRRPHEVPLSRQALAILLDLQEPTGHYRFVFKSMRPSKQVMSENSINSALRRMGFTKDQHTAHGFRSTASSLLNESGQFRSDVIELQLAHQDRDAVRRVYNRAEHWSERVRMMQWYADHLDELARGSRPADFSHLL